MSQSVYINKLVKNDLLWFADSAEHMNGVWVFEAESWSANDADLQIWGDACKIGLAFWVPSLKAAFIGDPIINGDTPFNIFL